MRFAGWIAALLAVLCLVAPVLAQSSLQGIFAATSARTGAPFAVSFSGKPGEDDRAFFSFVGADAPIAGEYDSAARLTTSPTMINAPFVPGLYELVVAHGSTILARLPVTVIPATASIDVQSPVPAGRVVSVSWVGPGAPGDYLAFALPGSPPGSFVGEAVETRTSPARLLAPSQPGTYELRYVQRALELRMVLASQPVEVR